jgi:flagellar hook-associated protein 1 FlgK
LGIPNIFNTGRSGMNANKAAIAVAGHNIANAGTEGFSRQRVETTALAPPETGTQRHLIGMGAGISRVSRANDEYVEKQIRNAGRELAHGEEKDVVLRQTEDIFNEMNGDGINRLVSRFFNEFRKLGNEPENEAVRQSVREATQALVNDFHRIRGEVNDVRDHIDSRLTAYCTDVNSLAEQIKDLNIKINAVEITGSQPNDLLDKRDQALKQLSSYMDLSMHKDNFGNFVVDIKGVGPLVAGPITQKFDVNRSPADDQGKPENAVDVKTTASANSIVTHSLKGGKMGALLEARDQTLSTILDRLDEMAFTVSNTVNAIHEQGTTRGGAQGVSYFKTLDQKDRAAELIELSDEVKANINNIATAAQPDAPGDNRIALAIAGLQSQKLMSDGKATLDDWYNSIVSDVGVTTLRNRNTIGQQRDIMTQLNKMHDQISGVSIDEETANLMQFQHAFDASAKVIAVADEMMKTVLDLKR